MALLYPEPEKGGRGKKSSVAEDIKPERLSVAQGSLYSFPGTQAAFLNWRAGHINDLGAEI